MTDEELVNAIVNALARAGLVILAAYEPTDGYAEIAREIRALV